MRTVEEILKAARHLSPRDQRRLLEKLEDSLAQQDETKWKAKGKRRKDGLAMFIAMAGTAHSDYTDVSTDKYKHLAEIYADHREDK